MVNFTGTPSASTPVIASATKASDSAMFRGTTPGPPVISAGDTPAPPMGACRPRIHAPLPPRAPLKRLAATPPGDVPAAGTPPGRGGPNGRHCAAGCRRTPQRKAKCGGAAADIPRILLGPAAAASMPLLGLASPRHRRRTRGGGIHARRSWRSLGRRCAGPADAAAGRSGRARPPGSHPCSLVLGPTPRTRGGPCGSAASCGETTLRAKALRLVGGPRSAARGPSMAKLRTASCRPLAHP